MDFEKDVYVILTLFASHHL